MHFLTNAWKKLRSSVIPTSPPPSSSLANDFPLDTETMRSEKQPEKDISNDIIEVRPFSADPWSTTASTWAKPVKALKIRVSNEALTLGQPEDSLIARRHRWNRETSYGAYVDYDDQGSLEDATRDLEMRMGNRKWLAEKGMQPMSMEDFRAIDWKKSMNIQYEVQIAPNELLARLQRPHITRQVTPLGELTEVGDIRPQSTRRRFAIEIFQNQLDNISNVVDGLALEDEDSDYENIEHEEADDNSTSTPTTKTTTSRPSTLTPHTNISSSRSRPESTSPLAAYGQPDPSTDDSISDAGSVLPDPVSGVPSPAYSSWTLVDVPSPAKPAVRQRASSLVRTASQEARNQAYSDMINEAQRNPDAEWWRNSQESLPSGIRHREEDGKFPRLPEVTIHREGQTFITFSVVGGPECPKWCDNTCPQKYVGWRGKAQRALDEMKERFEDAWEEGERWRARGEAALVARLW